MSESLNPATGGSSDTGLSSSLSRPTIKVYGAEGNEESHGSSGKTPKPTTTHTASAKVLESASSRQESPKSIGAPHHPQSPVEGSFIPSKIAYYLRLEFDLEGCSNFGLEKEKFVLLHTPESYQKIEKAGKKYAKILSAGAAESIGSKELKFFFGNCTIVSDNDTKIRLPLRCPEDWTEVNKAIVGYWNAHTQERLHLCISRHYLASQQQPTEGKCFAEVKILEIDDQMKETWEGKGYIPHNVLETVISDETIYWIIKEDPPQSVPPEQQEAFIHKVQAEGRILLAMCVHARLGMECLKKLLDSGLKDSTLPLDEKFKCHHDCRGKLKNLIRDQGGYQAERFIEGQHKTLHPHAVVPLHFYPRAHGNDDLDHEITEGYGDTPQSSPTKENTIRRYAKCGSGAYSNVYCVKFNPNHHGLSVVSYESLK